jgi:hypothetical protein
VLTARSRSEGQLVENPASDESSRVNMAYFMLAMLRMGGVLASRTELQDKGVLDPDCPVCLGQLGGGNGFVTFHLLECGHRCEAARTCAVWAPHVRAFDTDAKVELLTLARVPVACVAGSTRTACSKSRRRQMPPAACWSARARFAVARHDPRAPLWCMAH